MNGMSGFFRNYFIPHEGNDLKPRFFLWETAVVVFSVTLFLELLFLVQIFWILPAVNYSANILPGVIVSLTNENRSAYSVPTLVSNGVLARAAQEKAEDMARKGYFSHESPGGETPWDWLDRAGYDFVQAGENLAVNFVDSEDVVSAWMRSQSHKTNILNGGFTEIGIGIARGVFEGKNAVFVVQFFGRPAVTQESGSRETLGSASAGGKTSIPQTKPQVAGKTSIPQTKPPTTPSETSPAATQKTQETPAFPGTSISLSLLKEFFSLPHRLINYLYVVMLTMIALAFSLMVFVKIRVQHPRLLLNGAVMLLFIGSLIVFNHYLLLSQIKVL